MPDKKEPRLNIPVPKEVRRQLRLASVRLSEQRDRFTSISRIGRALFFAWLVWGEIADEQVLAWLDRLDAEEKPAEEGEEEAN